MRLIVIGIGLISLVLPLGLAGPAGRSMQEAAKHMPYRAEAEAAGLAERVRRTTTNPPNCSDADGVVWPEGEGDNCTTYTGIVSDTRCIGWINGEDFTNITTSAPNHTKVCMLTCWDFLSGYTLMEKVGEGDYRAKYRLDDWGGQEILKLLAGSVSCKAKNLTVTVRGVVGPPATWKERAGGGTYVETDTYNGHYMGDTFRVDLLFENDPYDCPGHTKQPYPPAPDCGGCPTMMTTSNCASLDSSDQTDSGDDDCGYYNWYPDDCSFFDDDDFVAAVLCCACAGGQPVASGAAKDAGAVGLAVGVSFVVVAIIAGVLTTLYIRDKRNRERLANLPFSFDPMIQELREIGLLGHRSNSIISSSTSIGVIEPVELTRHKVTMFEKIGSGQFGAVHRAEIPNPDPEATGKLVVAVKLLKGADPSSAEREDFLKEAAITAQFAHDNVVSLVGVVTTGLPYWIVLQFCANGSLRHVLKKLKHAAPPDGLAWPQQFSAALLDYCRGIAHGMRYLSSRRFVHRDLAARNILVDGTTPKVSDFGLSRELEDENAVYYRSSNAATKLPIRWCAPEVINDLKFGEASDVWAFGITCCEIFGLGKTPYAEMKNPEVNMKVSKEGYHHPRPSNCPQRIWEDVIEPCFVTESKDRPSFIQLLKKCMVVADAPNALQGTRNVGLNYSKRSASESGSAVPGLAAHFSELDGATTTSRYATPRVTERRESREAREAELGTQLNKLESFDDGLEAVGKTRQGSEGSLHNYEGINTALDMTLQRGDVRSSVLETSKWAQEQAGILAESPVRMKTDRSPSQREQGLPPPMYAGSPIFRPNSLISQLGSDGPTSRQPSFAESCGGNDNAYEVPVPQKVPRSSSGLSAAGSGASRRASLLAI